MRLVAVISSLVSTCGIACYMLHIQKLGYHGVWEVALQDIKKIIMVHHQINLAAVRLLRGSSLQRVLIGSCRLAPAHCCPALVRWREETHRPTQQAWPLKFHCIQVDRVRMVLFLIITLPI